MITGLTPGLHVNTIAFLLPLFFGSASAPIVTLIVSMAVAHSFFDFLPSIALGAPDSESYLSILPGHRYLLKGQAYKALILTIAGGMFSGLAVLAVLPVFLFILPGIEWLLPKLIPLFLSCVVAITVLFSKHKKETSIAVFLSAILGIIVLNGLSLQNGVMAIVIGLFSLSTLFISLIQNTKAVKQNVLVHGVDLKNSLKGSLLAVAGSAMISIMPGIGPSQAAFLIRKTTGNIGNDCYLAMLGGINTCNILFSLFVLYAIGKTRTGIALAIKNFAFLDSRLLLLFVGSALIATAFSIFFLQHIGKTVLRRMHLFSYMKINALIAIALLLFLAVFCGPLALLVSIIACFIGCYTALNRVARSSCMAFLIVPTILIYLGL